MACANKKIQASSIVEDFNSLNLFGKCQPQDILFTANENKERERKFISAQKERELELKKQEQDRKEQEKALKEAILTENEKKRRRKRIEVGLYVPPKSSGRGNILNGAVNGRTSEVKTRGRGRGRLSSQEKQCLPLFERAQNVQRNLNQYSDSSLHNNKVQKEYWKELGQYKEEEYDCNTAECFTSYTPESSLTSDQYEDAESTLGSSSPQSFTSVPSQSSISPISAWLNHVEPDASSDIPLQQPQLRPEANSFSPRVRKPRRSRVAANFSNNVEEDVVNEGIQYNDDDIMFITKEETVGVPTPLPSEADGEEEDIPWVLRSSTSPLAPSKIKTSRRSTGVSFNSLNPSQRVLSNNVLRPEELYASAGTSNDFTLNMNEFPAL